MATVSSTVSDSHKRQLYFGSETAVQCVPLTFNCAWEIPLLTYLLNLNRIFGTRSVVRALQVFFSSMRSGSSCQIYFMTLNRPGLHNWWTRSTCSSFVELTHLRGSSVFRPELDMQVHFSTPSPVQSVMVWTQPCAIQSIYSQLITHSYPCIHAPKVNMHMTLTVQVVDRIVVPWPWSQFFQLKKSHSDWVYILKSVVKVVEKPETVDHTHLTERNTIEKVKILTQSNPWMDLSCPTLVVAVSVDGLVQCDWVRLLHCSSQKLAVCSKSCKKFGIIKYYPVLL